MKTSLRDLADFGLILVGPESDTFSNLVREIEDLPASDLDQAAVLLNQSGKALVTLSYIWRYTTAKGTISTMHHSTLGSSTQTDFLSGHSELIRDAGSFILPGSKRLINQQRMFGSNLDVLPAESSARGGGRISVAGGGGGFGKESRVGEIAEIELLLDFVVFEDGLCVGPDESGMFQTLTEELKLQHNTAEDIVEALRQRASAGQIFEILRPLARRTGHRTQRSPVLNMFANSAIHRLVNFDDPDWLPWFERVAQASPLPLHRP